MDRGYRLKTEQTKRATNRPEAERYQFGELGEAATRMAELICPAVERRLRAGETVSTAREIIILVECPLTKLPGLKLFPDEHGDKRVTRGDGQHANAREESRGCVGIA